ncbi:MAG TPA: MBL fold metallo-hydrolase [Clostridia bacterium]|nr:MBL fold metallo-hydrolase [Clostridia bacterium]
MSYIQFLGAAGTVTGSKHLVNSNGDLSGRTGLQVLVDCGMFQGPKEWRLKNWEETPIAAKDIEAVILTHAHLDHSGWIPRLVKEGFRGRIYATPPTVDLCAILLPDSGYLQEEDARFHNKRKTSKHSPALPLYTFDEARECLDRFTPVPFGKSMELSPTMSFRFVRAAHILGSAMAEITLKLNGSARKLVFTGDIGRVKDSETAPGKVVYSGPQEGIDADVLVMESTYGNREHPDVDVRPKMAQMITEAARRGGTVVVPAFAVERTQKFLFLLKELMEEGKIPRIPVSADSPMAIEAVKIFLKHTEEFSDETKKLIARHGSPLEWPGFNFAITAEQSKKLNDARYPSIIVSSNGMCMGGRIQHHLIHRLPDPRNLILFIGFQAPGTRGRQIKDGAREVKIFGEIVPVRAQVGALEQFSDHADTSELLQWLGTFKRKPAVTHLVHGEPEATQMLRDAITAKLGWNVDIAEYLRKVPIK